MSQKDIKMSATAVSGEGATADAAKPTDRREPWETPRIIMSTFQEVEKFPNVFEGDPGDNNGFNS